MASELSTQKSPKIRAQKAIYSGSRCCAPQCKNREGTDKEASVKRSYYRFPKDPELKAKYEEAIRRDDGEGGIWRAKPHDRICSDHFVGGKKTHQPGTPGFILSVFKRKLATPKRTTHTAEKAGAVTPLPYCEDSWAPAPPKPRKKPKCLDFSKAEQEKAEAATAALLKETGHDYVQTAEDSSDSEHLVALNVRIAELEKENEDLRAKVLNLDQAMKCSDREFQRYTNMPNLRVFKAVSDYLFRRSGGKLKYWRGSGGECSEHYAFTMSSKPGQERSLSFEEEFFLILVKLKSGDFNHEIARKFNISEAMVSKVITTWVNFLPEELKLLFEMKTSEEDKESIPSCYQDYPQLQVTIDCTELKTERSSTLQARKELYSNYKGGETIKFMVGLSPNLTVNYVSKGYGGRASDKHITMSSAEFLNLLGTSSTVMADRGFNVEKELNTLDVQLVIPDFKGRGRSQMSASEAANSEKISSARIHIERVIQRIRTYHVLGATMRLAQQDIIDQIFQICAYLTNFQLPIKKLHPEMDDGSEMDADDGSSIIDILEAL